MFKGCAVMETSLNKAGRGGDSERGPSIFARRVAIGSRRREFVTDTLSELFRSRSLPDSRAAAVHRIEDRWSCIVNTELRTFMNFYPLRIFVQGFCCFEGVDC